MTIRYSVAFAAVLILSACGGGSGGSPTAVMPAPPTTQMPTDPPKEILTRDTSPGPTADRVTDYLYWHASGGPWEGCCGTYSHPPGLVRFASPPTVRMTTGMTERERAIAHYGVALVNRALPYDQHVHFGPDAPSVTAHFGDDLRDEVPDGQIFIEFPPRRQPHRRRRCASRRHRCLR